jgi:hypothetical protein
MGTSGTEGVLTAKGFAAQNAGIAPQKILGKIYFPTFCS